MKKFILIFSVIFAFAANAQEKTMENEIQTQINSVLKICGPNITDEYIPDLVLSQQYADSAICIEEQIKVRAKSIFDEKNYDNFQKALHQTSKEYLKIVTYLNEKTIDDDEFTGTLDRLNTQIEWYNFLVAIMKQIIHQQQQIIEKE